jgi:hypothetical protein
MSLNLYEILKKVLNESVGSKEISDAIINHNYVEITYVDENSNAPGTRLIQPYAYGISKANNDILRAFQMSGDTLRGEPHWKTFRLDRITSWKPRKQTFNIPPPMQGYRTEDYNDNGDGSMATVYLQAKFDNKGSLGVEKAKTELIKNAPKISAKNTQGPIPFASQQRKKNVFTSQPNSEKYAKYAKNIKDTESELNRFDNDIWSKAEAERQQQNNTMLQNSAKQPKQIQSGPIGVKNNAKKDKEEDDGNGYE